MYYQHPILSHPLKYPTIYEVVATTILALGAPSLLSYSKIIDHILNEKGWRSGLLQPRYEGYHSVLTEETVLLYVPRHEGYLSTVSCVWYEADRRILTTQS